MLLILQKSDTSLISVPLKSLSDYFLVSFLVGRDANDASCSSEIRDVLHRLSSVLFR